MLTSAPFDPADQAQYALLIIGVRDQLAQKQVLSRCSVLLPLVATAFEAVITTLLLKERVDELEREMVREALESMELLRAELLGTVSHELRGPLASIKGYAAMLADPRRLREMLDRLLDNACTYSPEGGPVTVTLRPVNQGSPGVKAGVVPQTSQQNDPDKAPVLCNMLECASRIMARGFPPSTWNASLSAFTVLIHA